MSQDKNKDVPEIPKVLKVGKDEHLVIMLDGNHHDRETLEMFRKKLQKQFPKLNGRVLLLLGEGIQLAKV